ncbi:MAG TPA: hypothetical protein VII56_17530 [Rhizomicrobium sp.]
MKRTLAIGFLAFALSGCVSGPDQYARNGTTKAQFNQDFAGCRLVAMGMPERHTQVNSYVANTDYFGGTTTTTIEPDSGAALGSALGDLIHNNRRAASAIRLCMQAKGYSLQAQR